MTRKGTVGNCSVYPNLFPEGIMHSDLLRLRLDRQQCLPIYLSWQLTLSQDVAHQVSLVSSGAIMAGINVTKLKDIQVLLPPLDMQRRFERVIDYHSKVLNRYFTCAQRTDDLFQSLVARAFRGELTSSATDEILQQAVVS